MRLRFTLFFSAYHLLVIFNLSNKCLLTIIYDGNFLSTEAIVPFVNFLRRTFMLKDHVDVITLLTLAEV